MENIITSAFPKASPLTQCLNNYQAKIKQKALAMDYVKKITNPNNLLTLLDFLNHAIIATDNANMLCKSDVLKNDKIARKVLSKFDSVFKNTTTDLDILHAQGKEKFEETLECIEYVVENIALLHVVEDIELHKAIAVFREFPEEVGIFCDELNKNTPYTSSYARSERETKNICELIVNLIFCQHLVKKFVVVDGYNPKEIISYSEKVLNLLGKYAKEGLERDFNITVDEEIIGYFRKVCGKFFNLKTSGKEQFASLFKTYKNHKAEFLNKVTQININNKSKKGMDQINKLVELSSQAQIEAEAFYNKGNKAAGTRLRKVMMEIKKLADDVRKNVTETKNAE